MFVLTYLKSSLETLKKRLDLLLKNPRSPSWRGFEAVRPPKVSLPFVVNIIEARPEIRTQNDLVSELKNLGYKFDQGRVSRLFSEKKSSLKRLKYLVETLKNYEPPESWG